MLECVETLLRPHIMRVDNETLIVFGNFLVTNSKKKNFFEKKTGSHPDFLILNFIKLTIIFAILTRETVYKHVFCLTGRISKPETEASSSERCKPGKLGSPKYVIIIEN